MGNAVRCCEAKVGAKQEEKAVRLSTSNESMQSSVPRFYSLFRLQRETVPQISCE